MENIICCWNQIVCLSECDVMRYVCNMHCKTFISLWFPEMIMRYMKNTDILVRPPASTNGITTNRAAVNKAVTPQQSQCRSIRDRPVTSTVLSVPAPPRPTTVVNPPPDTRQHGQWPRCLRTISLTAAGLVRSHGPNCSGSGQPPVDGSTFTASNVHPTVVCDVRSSRFRN